MKIAWFTPFSAKSAIGAFSRNVVEAFCDRADVTLFHFDAPPLLPTCVPVRNLSSHAELVSESLSEFDVTVYNLGNHLPFHRDIYEVSKRVPGICILHDLVMHHFFASYYLDYRQHPTGYLSAIWRHYGNNGLALAQEGLVGDSPTLWESDRVSDFPLWEEAVQGALGIVVHSDHFRSSVSARFAGPVRKIPLSYTADRVSPVLSRAELGLSDDAFVIVTAGHVNPNKCFEAVLEAISRSRALSKPMVYAIIGASSDQYRFKLDREIARLGLTDVVRFTGEASDQVLRSYLTAADICVNLRFPATEGASASAIEAMLFGKPLVVTDIGFFQELPENTVIRIPPKRPDLLLAAIDRLAVDPELRRNIGQAAEAYAIATFRPEWYAAEMVNFAEEILKSAPVLRLSDKLAAECRQIGITREMKVVDSLARRLSDLYCRGD